MYYRTKTNSKGVTRYEVVDKYKDPLTGKWKTAVVSYHKNTSRARKQAERKLKDKIERLVNGSEAQFNPQLIRTLTINADRDVALPKVACDAILRAIQRSEEFDRYAIENPCEAFTFSESVFRTEYGSPITSHSFREVLARVETDLIKNCEERYGFKWTKHVTPHSFRHMHITYLQSEGMKVAIKEIMERVGHANYETTMLYTHSQGISQNQTVKALDKFIDRNNFRFEVLKSWSSKYSKILNDEIENNLDSKMIEFSLDDFRDKLGLKSTHTPRHITANIIPKLKKDLSKYYKSFDISYLREGKQKVVGYRLTW